jgi:hypothetical protein
MSEKESLFQHVHRWRFGVTFGGFGKPGVFIGVPFVGAAREELPSRSFGFRWLGVCW